MKFNSFLVGQPTNKKNVQSNLDNSLENLLDRKLVLLLKEQRLQRSDLKDIKLMINKVLIDKHLQEQVDNYFESDTSENPEDSRDLD